jgi:hypothetical protein
MGSLWNRSGTIERYADDLRADGAQAFFFQGGTTTPLSVYADSGESDALPHPVEADMNGRWPDIFVPYTTSTEGYDVQVLSRFGETLSYSRRVPNPNPVDVSVVIPPERQVQTGMIHPEFVNAPKPGYCRLNGKTIGNGTTSGPNSERANADTIDLFTYCWNSMPDDIAPVLPGGRGASAASDFGSNKTLGLPSMRGATFAGLDDMGNSPAGNYGTLPFVIGNSIIPGSLLGANSVTLTIENIPAHVHTGSTSQHLGHVHNISGVTTGQRHPSNVGVAVSHIHTFGNFTPGDPGPHGGTGTAGSHTHTMNGATGVLPPGGIGATAGGTGSIGGTAVGSTDAAGDHTHTVTVGGNTGVNSIDHIHAVSGSSTALPGGGAPGEGAHSHTFTTDSKGGDPVLANATRAFNNMPVTRLVTWYIKL